MPRYALKIEYDGGPFCGWQRQNDLATVQGSIEDALRVLDKNCEKIQGAGRTDTGVHATGQVGHVDLSAAWDPFRLSEALNFHLKPLPIAIVDAAEVSDDFHARFSAQKRYYKFRLFIRRAPATHLAGLVWQVRHQLDVEAMREGAAFLIGSHDFTTFRSSTCQAKSPVKNLDQLDISSSEMQGGTEILFEISARSFLHNQVRSIVGTLERVGSGSWSPLGVRDALEARDRAACGPVCSPSGLYLSAGDYPERPFGE